MEILGNINDISVISDISRIYAKKSALDWKKLSKFPIYQRYIGEKNGDV